MNENKCRIVVSERSSGFCEARLVGQHAYRCLGMAQTMHHRRKRSQGGEWRPSNILHVCGDGTRGCHGYIEANPAMARKYGLWLFAGQHPVSSPAKVAFRGTSAWYLLDDEGNMTWLSRDALARLKPGV